MAISPKQLDKEFQNRVSEYEAILDNKLAKSKFSVDKSVNIDVPTGMSGEHFEILKHRYISAGWKSIEWHQDQREGEWLKFKY